MVLVSCVTCHKQTNRRTLRLIDWKHLFTHIPLSNQPNMNNVTHFLDALFSSLNKYFRLVGTPHNISTFLVFHIRHNQKKELLVKVILWFYKKKIKMCFWQEVAQFVSSLLCRSPGRGAKKLLLFQLRSWEVAPPLANLCKMGDAGFRL